MRRSCRLSHKHEHRLLKKAEAEAADAAAAEAAEEAAASVYPSTVTKAIAGLATPSLPSPSIFPEDWRMVEELLHDGQSHDGQPQSLCPTKLFADMESDCGPDGVLSCMDPLLPASVPKSASLESDAGQHAAPRHQAQPVAFPLAESMQAPMSFSQLLSEPEAEPGSASCSQAAPAAAPASHASFTSTDHGLPELSSSLDEVGLDCEGLDDMMWDELEDLGLDMASRLDMGGLGSLDMSRPPLLPCTGVSSALPNDGTLLPTDPSTYTLPASAPLFVPFSGSPAPAVPTLVQLQHHSLASQHSTDSTATVITSQQPSFMPHQAAVCMQQASIAASCLSLPPTAVATAGPGPQSSQAQAARPAVLPAKRTSKGKKAKAAADVQAAAAQAGGAATGAAPVPAGAPISTGDEAGVPVKRKRGPYKKRVRKEEEGKLLTQHKKKVISMMPAVEAFAKRIQPQHVAAASQQPLAAVAHIEQGPSKRARLEMPLPCTLGTVGESAVDQEGMAAPVYTTKVAVAALGHSLPHSTSHQQQQPGLHQQAVEPLSVVEDVPLVGAPRQFLQAAMQARLLGQSLQAGMPPQAVSQPRLPRQPPQTQLPSQHTLHPSTSQAKQQPNSRPHSAHRQPCAAAIPGGALQTEALDLRLQITVDPDVSRLLQEAARAHAACGRALSASPCPSAPSALPSVPAPTAPVPAAPATSTAAVHMAAPAVPTVPAVMPAATAANAATATAAAHAANASASADAAGMAHHAGPARLPHRDDTTPSLPPLAQDAGTTKAGHCNPLVAATSSAADALEVAVVVDHSGPAGSRPGAQSWSSWQPSRAPAAHAGRRPQPLNFAVPLLQGSSGSDMSSLTADRSLPLNTLSRFVSTASIASSSSRSSITQGHGNSQHPLNHSHASAVSAPDKQMHGIAPAACEAEAGRDQEPSSCQQAVTSLRQDKAGCLLDPAKLQKLESLQAAAQAAGLTLSWEESSGEDSDSSDSVFSGSGSGSGSMVRSGEGNGRVSLGADLEEVAGGQKDQIATAAESVGMRTRNGGSCSHRPIPSEVQKRKGTKHITMKFLEEGGYFDAPIQAAARQLQVGVTTLKKICRTAKVERWPFRKRTSIERLIERTEYFMGDEENLEQKIAELQSLLAEREGLKACQAKDVDPAIKKFRQSMFKRVHKEERDRRKAVKASKPDQLPIACMQSGAHSYEA